MFDLLCCLYTNSYTLCSAFSRSVTLPIIHLEMTYLKVLLSRVAMAALLLCFLATAITCHSNLFHASVGCDSFSDFWKSLKSFFGKHVVFSIFNAMVLAVLAISGYFSQSAATEGAQTSHKSRRQKPPATGTHAKIQKEKSRSAPRRKTMLRSQLQVRNSDLREPRNGGEILSIVSSGVRKDEQQPLQTLNSKNDLLRANGVRSPPIHPGDLIDEELNDLHERIDAFIVKVKREMLLQERQGYKHG